MQPIAVYPGTFDPMTNGHMDIIERAVKLFDSVIVAVAPTHRKKPYLSIEERLTLLNEVLKSIENVRVMHLQGLLVDFMKQQKVSIIVRGLRAASDCDYEFQLAFMNHRMAPHIETVFLPAAENCRSISGTMVREIVDQGGAVSAFVPAAVAKYLQGLKNHRS